MVHLVEVPDMAKKVVVLLSGGPDSSTLAFWAVKQGYDVRGLFVNSGQYYADHELAGARAVANKLSIHLEVAELDNFRQMLIGFIPHPYTAMGGDAEVWKRGGAFLPTAVACSYAAITGCEEVLVAMISEDIELWPDARSFIANSVPNLRLITKNKDANIRLPFADKRKAQVLQLGAELGVPFERTRTCQNTTINHCGTCARCVKRASAFVEAGIEDPTTYETTPVVVEESGITAA
jgi:7-cyano-7-deazaguanine synthase